MKSDRRTNGDVVLNEVKCNENDNDENHDDAENDDLCDKRSMTIKL